MEKVKPLTPADKIEIQELYYKYSYAVDHGDAAGRIATFTPDGTFATARYSNHQPKGVDILYKRTKERGNRGDRHIMTNIITTATAYGAEGHCYALLLDNEHRIMTGIYDDKLVKTAEGWRFKTRELWLDNEENSPYRMTAPKPGDIK